MQTWAKRFQVFIGIGFVMFIVGLGDGAARGDFLSPQAGPAVLRSVGGTLFLIGTALWIAKSRDAGGRPGLNPMFGLLLSFSAILALIGLIVLIASQTVFELGLQIGVAISAVAVAVGVLATIFAPSKSTEKYDYFWYDPEFDPERDAYSGGRVVSTKGYLPSDLTRIAGIDEATAKVLNNVGIRYFNRLADTSPEELAVVLEEAGIAGANSQSWPAQARLADNGEWDELHELQEKLAATATENEPETVGQA